MIKNFFVVCLIVAVMQIQPLSSYASCNLKLEAFDYYNSMEEVKELTPGETIYAKANVKRGSDSPESVVLITQIFQDGEVIDIISDSYVFQSEGEVKELKTSYTLPMDINGINIKSYVWDSFMNMNFLLNPSVFKSDNAGIECAYIYGKKIEDFDAQKKEYDIILPASSSDNPEIYCEPSDIGTKVSYVYEDGKIIVNSESHGGEKESYVFNYTKEPFSVTDISLTNTADLSFVYNGGIREDYLKFPEYDLDEEGKPKVTVFGANIFEKATKVFADKYHIYLDFPEEMEGAKIIETKRGTHGGTTSLNYKLKFTLNKTATLYFNTTAKCVPEGAVKLDKQMNYIEKNTYNDAIGAAYDPGTAGNVNKNIWKIKCEVPEGKESKTFEIELATTNYSGPILFIKD